MPVGHQYVFFGEVSIQNFCPFCNWLVCFLILSYMTYFYTLKGNPFGQHHLHTFSPVVWVLFPFCLWSPVLCKKLLSLGPVLYFCFYFNYSRRQIKKKKFVVIYVKQCSAVLSYKCNIFNARSVYFCTVLENTVISCLACSCQVFPAWLIEETVSSPVYILASLSWINWPYLCWFVSGVPILFHYLCVCWVLVPYWILMTAALYCSLKSASFVYPALFFFKIVLVTWVLLHFHTNDKFFCSSSVKNAIGNLIGIALNL